MLDLIYNLPIQKQDRKILVGKKLYCRDGLAAGIAFEHGILVLVGVLFYPPEPYSLKHDADSYPNNVILQFLQDKHGDDWERFYIPPRNNNYDVMGELQFSSLSALRSEIERLSNTFQPRLTCQNTEQDFAYQIEGVMPVLGDRPYLLAMANQILAEDRCEVSNACKRILSKDEPALMALGCCFATLERQTFYEFGHHYEDSTFAQSYS